MVFGDRMKKSQQTEKETPDNQSSMSKEDSDRFVVKIPGLFIAYNDGIFQIELPVFKFEISINLFLLLIKRIKVFYEKGMVIVKQHKTMATVISTIVLIVMITMVSSIWYVQFNKTQTQKQLLKNYTLMCAGCINESGSWLTTLKMNISNQDIFTAQELFLSNKIDLAEHLLRTNLQKGFKNENDLSFCNYALGRIMLIKEKYHEAEKYFNTATSLTPSFSIAILAKGLTFEKQGLLQQALKQYKASLTITEQKCKNLESNHLYHITTVLYQRIQTIETCQNSDDCRLNLTFEIEKLLKKPQKKSDSVNSKSGYGLMFLSLNQTGLNFPYTGENIYWTDVFARHTCSQSDQVHQVDPLMVFGLLKRIELPYSSVNNLKIALNIARYLPVDFIISGNISYENTNKTISVKILNAQTGDIVSQISEEVLNNRIEEALKRLASQINSVAL